jgi:hypothetical protein
MKAGVIGMDVRSGWGRIGEAVPRAGVASLIGPSSSSRSRGGMGMGESAYGRDSLDFPPPRAPRRSLANVSAYTTTSTSAHAHAHAARASQISSMPSSPPSGNTFSDMTFDSVDGTHDTFTANGNGNGAPKRKRAMDVGDDSFGAEGDESMRRISPTRPVGGAVSKSTSSRHLSHSRFYGF